VGPPWQMIDATVIRAHHCAAGGKGGPRATRSAVPVEVSRPGSNARTNGEGLPIGIEITPGQTHDITAYPALMDDIDCDPEQMLGDKVYDSETVRRDIEQRGGEAVIPSLASRKNTACSGQGCLRPAPPCCWRAFASGSGLST
jgi:Transposase DDE domain